ncbi:hypothetical protein BH23ACT12_BH23ACT12_01590 [soil metagenome]
MGSRIKVALFRPVDSGSVAYFRIIFGLVVSWEAWRYFKLGWIDRFFVEPQFLFTYWPFHFVSPWPGWGMKAHFFVLGGSGILVALGAFYRVASVVLFTAMAYVFLLEKVNYLNHLYLVCLLAFLMIFLPVHRIWSVDVLRRPALGSATVPAWVLWVLRFQLALPYFFGGVAKLNGDWLQGEPLRMWLAGDTDFPLIGRYFTEEQVVLLMSYGALVLDLLVVFLLLWRRTRPFAYVAAILFHFMNSRLFNIGIFPWLMIAGTALFFPADWPRRVLADLRRRPGSVRSIAWWTGAVLGALLGWKLPTTFTLPQVGLGALGVAIALYSLAELRRPLPGAPADSEGAAPAAGHHRPGRPGVVLLLSVWVAVQVLLPLRHLVIPGEVFWTEEGQRFSWMMLVRSKQGEVSFVVNDTSRGDSWEVMPEEYLARRQVLVMSNKPEMVVQFARYLEEVFRKDGYEDIQVRARTAISLNNRPPRPIIDPEVDLTEVEVPLFGSADWILPER